MEGKRVPGQLINCDEARWRKLLAIEKAVKGLLAAKIRTLNGLRMTVSTDSLVRLRDAYRPAGDMGENDQWPLREIVKARAAKGK